MKMVNMNTADLTGPQLDWAVAKAEGFRMTTPKHGGAPNYKIMLIPNGDEPFYQCAMFYGRYWHCQYLPSSDWISGGPIIEHENIWLSAPSLSRPEWTASVGDSTESRPGSTTLVAAMRAFVASKLGDEVEVPEVPI